MENIILAAAIIAVVKALRDAASKEYGTSIIVAVCGLLGLLAAAGGVIEANAITGFLVGLGASGTYAVATKIGSAKN